MIVQDVGQEPACLYCKQPTDQSGRHSLWLGIRSAFDSVMQAALSLPVLSSTSGYHAPHICCCQFQG